MPDHQSLDRRTAILAGLAALTADPATAASEIIATCYCVTYP